MKKITLTAIVLSTLSIPSVFAATNNVGCGVGSMIWEGRSGIAPQVLAVTTNGILSNQMFGITLGTLGCSKNGVVSVPEKVAQFTGDNLDKLAREMAVGTGETLNSLAALMEVTIQDKPLFFSTVKAHFAEIFPSDSLSSTEVLANLSKVLANEPSLKQYSYS